MEFLYVQLVEGRDTMGGDGLLKVAVGGSWENMGHEINV